METSINDSQSTDTKNKITENDDFGPLDIKILLGSTYPGPPKSWCFWYWKHFYVT